MAWWRSQVDPGRLHIQRQIADSSAAYQKALEEKRRFIVGVNVNVDPEEELPFEPFELDHDLGERQIKRTRSIRSLRNAAEHSAALKEVRHAAVNNINTMPAVTGLFAQVLQSARFAM